MGPAEFDFESLANGERLAELRETTHREGCFRIRHPLFPPSRCADALSLAEAFFQMPAAEKERLAIEQSAHFRGYSVMQSRRDWREQIHFGREEPPRQGSRYQQLRGPNQWPSDEFWRRGILSLIDDLEIAGRDILGALSRSLGLPERHFLPESEVPYLLLKLIHYPALAGGSPRSGVAPHVDFSWITLLLQDDAGGLETQRRDGSWLPAPAVPGTVLVHAGEILQFATGAYYCAAPHRVVSGIRSRVSLPFFLNPALDASIGAVALPADRGALAPIGDSAGGAHVHRVFSEPRLTPFVFGDQEWRRKGEGIYCGSCCVPGLSAPDGS